MQYKHIKQKLDYLRSVCRITPARAALLLIALAFPAVAFAPVALASGDASFSFSTSGGTTVGDTFSVTVSETSSVADAVDGVQANLSYPSELQYQGYTQGAFTLCAQTPTSSVVGDGCASTSALSGKQTVVTVTFTVIGSGSGQVKMITGSPSTDIDNGSGASVWDGVLASGTYSFSAASSGGGSGSSGGSSGGSSSGSSSSSKSSGSSSTGSKASTGSTSGTSAGASTTAPATTPPSTVIQTPTTATPTVAALSITVTDSKGNPVKGAKVSIDGKYTAYTNAQGAAAFTGVGSGSHKVTVSASGKVTSESTFSLAANQSKTVSLKLASTKSSAMSIVYIVAGVVVLGGACGAYLMLRRGQSNGPFTPTHGVVVGGSAATTLPTPSGPSASQVVAPSQPMPDPTKPIDPSFKQ